MATLNNRNGARYIQFRDGDLRRHIGLGHMSDKHARTVLEHVEQLIASKVTASAPPVKTAQWLAEIREDLHAKLAKVELVGSRDAKRANTLKAYCQNYVKNRVGLKRRTIINLNQAVGMLSAFFSPNRDICAINRAEARDWHDWMKHTKKLATATVAMHVKKARQIFADALDRKLIAENPFKAVKVGSQANEGRMEYVPADVVDAVIARCPTLEWRLIFALARYGGLRVPSETNRLRWRDVDFDKGRIVVRPTKTERYEGKDRRVIPMFPELRPLLEEAKRAADSDEARVITTLRAENQRRMAEKIIERAGKTPWGKLFQNLRASRETDLMDDYAPHIVCQWIGNSEAVAKKHYLMVKDAAFDKATNRAARRAAPTSANGGQMAYLNGENPRYSEGFAEMTYPQGESNPCSSAENRLS